MNDQRPPPSNPPDSNSEEDNPHMADRSHLANTTTAGSAELALRKHGLTSIELLKLANAAAAAGLNRMKPPPPLDHHERDDLIAALVEYGLRWALVYDIDQDARRNFATSVYSRMRLRVVDWCRTNIHDARFGTDKRHIAIDLAEWGNLDHDTRRTDTKPTLPWADTTHDAFSEPDFQDTTVSRIRTERWRTAAAQQGLTVEEWIVKIADQAADRTEEAA
jgi:hypothetical protein